MLRPFRYGTGRLSSDRRREVPLEPRGVAQGVARVRYRLFSALRRDDLGTSI